MKRRRRLPFRSEKAEAAAPLRAEVRSRVLHRDGYCCQLRGHGDCGGTLDVHEIVRRSQHPGAQYEDHLCVTLCRRHHEMDVHRHLAESLGIRVPEWAYVNDPAVIDEARRIREAWRKPGVMVPGPSWWPETD